MEEKLTRITDARMKCPSCGFRCKVGECFPDVDGHGRLGCPICFTVVKEDE